MNNKINNRLKLYIKKNFMTLIILNSYYNKMKIHNKKHLF